MGGWELGRVTMESKIQAVLAGRHPEELKVAELKHILDTIGKSKKGKKADLIARYRLHARVHDTNSCMQLSMSYLLSPLL